MPPPTPSTAPARSAVGGGAMIREIHDTLGFVAWVVDRLLIKLVAYKLSVFENIHDKLPGDKKKTGSF